MAALVRSTRRLVTYLFLLVCWACLTLASPVGLVSHGTNQFLLRRDVTVSNATGTIQVFDSSTGQIIPQGSASDGSGRSGKDITAILWMGFLFLIGVPLAVAGVRGWRLTTGAGVGLGAAVCSWAAFINTVNNIGIPDLVLMAFVMAFFAIGFIFGLFELGRLAGITVLCIVGGLAFGIRVVMLKEGLLVPVFFVNWLVIAVFGAFGGGLMIWKQRVGITLGSASAGTFLFSLGLDLTVSKLTGMSRGLRLLFDGNPAHIAEIIQNVYRPTLTTRIIIAVSLGITPILAYAQHRMFPHPFDRRPVDDWTIRTMSSYEKDNSALIKSRFSI